MSISHISGPLAIGGDAYESLITTKALDSEDNGKTFGLNLAGGFTITLPALSTVNNGWKVHFRVEITNTGNHTITENAADTNSLVGGFAASVAQTSPSDFEVTGVATAQFRGNSSVIGDWMTITTNGLKWFVDGRSSIPAGLMIS